MRMLVTFLFLAAIGVAGWAISAVYLPKGGTPRVTETIFVRKGQPSSEICRELERAGIIDSARRFYWAGRILGKWEKIRTGEYQVSSDDNTFALFATLTSGVSVRHRFTVAEGSNLYEIGKALEESKLGIASRFVAAARNSELLSAAGLGGLSSAEGYLYPDTYMLDRTMNEEDVARSMIQLFRKNWDPAWDARARELGFTRHQVVTLASMIEKETGAAEERPLIGSVFHNRLRKRMRLQSDPTTIYGIWERFDGNLRRSNLLEPTPYNTYAIPALPIGPIANPGREAIRAALFPETSDYLYFVSRNDGTHEFTRTYAEHSAAVRRFQLNPREREGKSWRDLKSKPASR